MIWFDLPYGILLGFLFVLGTVIGSFLNVCIHRLPAHESVWQAWKSLTYPPSRCPKCFTHILPRDNVPILAWLLLGGRCRACQAPISSRYPLIELLNGLLFAVVFWVEIPANWWAPLRESGLFTELGPQGVVGSYWLSPMACLLWRYALHMVLIEALLVATMIDFDLRIIPDSVTLPAMFLGVVGNTVLGQVYLLPVWFQHSDLRSFLTMLYDGQPLPAWLKTVSGWWIFSGQGVPAWIALHPHWHGLAVSLAGIVIGGGLVWTVRVIGHRVLRQEAMGFGDVVLLAMIGSILGWQAAVLVFVFAPVFAIISVIVVWFFRPQREIPYGPYLSLACLAILLGWKPLWPLTQRIFEMGPFLVLQGLLMAVSLYVLLQLTQFVKWCLGWELYPPEWIEEWSSADQLTYLAGEQVDPRQGQWKTDERWPGQASSRGQSHQQNWQTPRQQGNGWHQMWQRRGPLS